jgi:DNA-binding NtrC family response regulator
MLNKNILVAIDSGIVGLDIQKQLNGYGYNVETVFFLNKEKIRTTLNRHFQLMILERCLNDEGIEYALQLARENNLPVICISTDNEIKKIEGKGLRFLMMPFSSDDLRKTVKISLGEN